MANKLTRIQLDTGMKDFMPKTSFTEEDVKGSKSPGIKPSITIKRQKLKEEFVPGKPTREVESEFGVHIGKDKKGFFFKKTFKRGGDVMPARNKKNFRPTKAGAGMTELSVMWNTGSITQTSLHMLRKVIQ